MEVTGEIKRKKVIKKEAGMEQWVQCPAVLSNGKLCSHVVMNLQAHIRRMHQAQPIKCPMDGCSASFKQKLVSLIFMHFSNFFSKLFSPNLGLA